MKTNSDLFRLQRVFRDVFDDPTLVIHSSTSTSSLQEWDSIATVRIILAAESEFGVRFKTDDVASVKSVSDLLEMLGKDATNGTKH